MKVRFYKTMSKRNNSTKLPTAEPYTELDVCLKEATSIENPTLLISGNHFDYTYAYIADWSRYYFIRNILSTANGLTEIEMVEDYLASWKNSITSTIAYIAYSSTGWDKNIVDSRICSKTTKVIRSTPNDPGWFDAQGCFILSIIGKSGSANGFAASYVMDQLELSTVCANLMAIDIEARVIKSIYAPFDCVISCTWLPVAYNTAKSGTTDVNILFGDYDSGITGHKLTYPTVKATQASITFNPTYTDFRAIQPFTSYALYIPNYGIVDLNASDIRDVLENSNLAVGYSIDIASGDMTVHIGNPVVQTLQFNIGVNCPISQTSTNMTGSIGGAAGTVGGIAATIGFGLSGNIPAAVASGVGALASAANTALNFNARSTSVKGGISGRSMIAWGTTFQLIEYTMVTVDPDNSNYIAKHGRPVGFTHAISNHTGYVQTEGASVEISGLDSERNAINSLLNNGIYIE